MASPTRDGVLRARDVQGAGGNNERGAHGPEYVGEHTDEVQAVKGADECSH